MAALACEGDEAALVPDTSEVVTHLLRLPAKEFALQLLDVAGSLQQQTRLLTPGTPNPD